jgi:hypothetical protein
MYVVWEKRGSGEARSFRGIHSQPHGLAISLQEGV